MFKACGRLLALPGVIALTVAWALVARADDDKDTSGRLFSWTVTADGKDVLGSESLRVVETDSGSWFASGEIKLKKGKKIHRKSHLQRDASGKLVKYQRVEAGLKGAGLRLFEWQGQMRVAPVNDAGKPADVGALASARIWDDGLWHLYQAWDLPRQCETVRLPYFAPGKRSAGEAVLRCAGPRKLWDDHKKAIDVNRFEVSGVDGEAVELWVDGEGGLVGATSATRTMLRTKYALEAGKALGDGGEPGDGEPDKDAIKDRGVGE